MNKLIPHSQISNKNDLYKFVPLTIIFLLNTITWRENDAFWASFEPEGRPSNTLLDKAVFNPKYNMS